MTNYKWYLDIPKDPQTSSQAPTGLSAPLELESYCLNVIQSKREGLLKLEERYKKKYSKYYKIFDRLVWLNACSSSLRMTARISSMATLSTFIALPVSIRLGAVSLARTSISGAFTVLTKKYQNKLTKVTK